MAQNDNFFSLFGLPVKYDLDPSTLTFRYRELQRQFHPDKFASKSGSEQSLSMRQAALINDAYANLKDPLLRAKYILELNHIDLNGESGSIMDPAFLMQQMEMREALESVKSSSDPLGALDSVADLIDAEVTNLKSRLSKQFADQEKDYNHIADDVRKWQFYTRLQVELDELYSRYEKM